jgi:hypothetical protein
LFKNAQHKEVIEKINTVNIEFLDILKQECLNIFQAIAIYNTQDKDSAYQFIDSFSVNYYIIIVIMIMVMNYVLERLRNTTIS